MRQVAKHHIDVKKKNANMSAPQVGPEVTVLGLGYIGLPTALLLADAGVRVRGVDVDRSKLRRLKAGRLPFAEPGLDKLWRRVQQTGAFSFADRPSPSPYYLIAVPTPRRHHRADLQMVMAAVGSIKAQAPPRAMVIIESTVGVLDPVEKILPAVKSIRPDARLAYCPERALPGNTLSEMVYNDRVIGADDEAAGRQAAQLYRRFVKGKISRTDLTTAAAVKLLENTYRSVNIALANQLAQIAEHAGFDAWQAIELANKHPRVNVHRPGPGVGGHCLPIDPWFLAGADLDHSSLIRLALEINAAMPRYVAGRVGALAAQLRLSSLTIGLLGLSYKADVDDIRESPGLELAALLDKRVTVLAHDPHVTSRPPDHPNIRLVPLSQLHRQAQLVVIAVDHQEFSKLDWGKFRRLKAVIDTRQTLSPTTVEELRARQVVVSQLGVPQAPKKVPIRL